MGSGIDQDQLDALFTAALEAAIARIEKDRTFSLSQEERVNFARPSIDVLFETAAAAYGPRLIAVVLTGSGGIVEVQGTAEEKPFSRTQFESLLHLAEKGVAELVILQRSALGLD